MALVRKDSTECRYSDCKQRCNAVQLYTRMSVLVLVEKMQLYSREGVLRSEKETLEESSMCSIVSERQRVLRRFIASAHADELGSRSSDNAEACVMPVFLETLVTLSYAVKWTPTYVSSRIRQFTLHGGRFW